MGIFERLFRKRGGDVPDVTTAFPLNFKGAGPYAKPLTLDHGVVFEDDGDTGFFYATDRSHLVILDALHVYNRADSDALRPGEQVFIVWNPSRHRVGLFYHNQFQAVFDFSMRKGVCRTGFPAPSGDWKWSEDGHAWDESMTRGLEP